MGQVAKGDLCRVLTPPALAEITGATSARNAVTPASPGRDDGCFAASSSGLAVEVEVWSEHGDLEQDIVDLGSPAATESTEPTSVAGHEALTAAAEVDGRQLSDLVVHVDDRVLLVLVQRYAMPGEDATPEDGVELAVQLAGHTLAELGT